MKTHRSSSFIPAVLAGTALYFSANAAPPNVDAGSLLRQNEQDIKAPRSAPKLQPTPHTPAPATSADQATVQVRAFKFAGNTLLSNEVLVQAVAPYADRALSVAQLKEVADVVKNTYREAGWSVRTYLPKQEVNGGVVTIQIVEAVFGGASLSGAEPQRIEAARLVEMADASLVKGTPLHAAQLDRTLLLLDDLPGVNVTGTLVQGEKDGETNLALVATDEALVVGNAFIDNQGARATGIERLILNLNINSPALMGDSLTTNLMQTHGINYARGSYSLPVGYNGARAGVHASSLKYKVLTSYDDKAAGTRGTADTVGFNASYPLLRSQFSNANLTWSYDDKTLENYVADVLDSNYKIKASSIGLNSSSIDNWGGGGSTSANATITQGRVNNEGSANAQADADGARTAGSYSKLSVGLNRLQSISADLSFYAAVSAQATSKNLDSSERIYLGGATGIRAFPASEAGGAAGRTLTLELRHRLDNAFTLTGFYDYGHVTVNKNNANASNGAAISAVNAYALQGYGVTVAWQATQAIDFKVTVAQRMGSNPAASDNGMDGDGTKKITRIWLSSGITF